MNLMSHQTEHGGCTLPLHMLAAHGPQHIPIAQPHATSVRLRSCNYPPSKTVMTSTMMLLSCRTSTMSPPMRS